MRCADLSGPQCSLGRFFAKGAVLLFVSRLNVLALVSMLVRNGRAYVPRHAWGRGRLSPGLAGHITNRPLDLLAKVIDGDAKHFNVTGERLHFIGQFNDRISQTGGFLGLPLGFRRGHTKGHTITITHPQVKPMYTTTDRLPPIPDRPPKDAKNVAIPVNLPISRRHDAAGGVEHDIDFPRPSKPCPYGAFQRLGTEHGDLVESLEVLSISDVDPYTAAAKYPLHLRFGHARLYLVAVALRDGIGLTEAPQNDCEDAEDGEGDQAAAHRKTPPGGPATTEIVNRPRRGTTEKESRRKGRHMQPTRAQARKLTRGVYPGLNYLYRLKKRMIEVGFLPDDPLLQLVEKAYDAQQRLYVEANYLASEGAGRPSAR